MSLWLTHPLFLPSLIVGVTIVLWATSLLPEFITALLFFAAAMMAKIAPPEVIFGGFASSAFWLVFSGFVLGIAIRKTGLADRAAQALASALAAERFARMVAAQGGPADVLTAPLPTAPVIRDIPGLRGEGTHVARIDATALGHAVLALGGGRIRAGAPIDPAVGLTDLARLGEPAPRLGRVHAASEEAAEAAIAAVQAAYTLGPPTDPGPLIRERLT